MVENFFWRHAGPRHAVPVQAETVTASQTHVLLLRCQNAKLRFALYWNTRWALVRPPRCVVLLSDQ
ncbi:MAG: hypothetical protein DWI22_21080 [Planctomycetota bacterium]|nr:MAG: hypothetical protein DWI22_21080 [Planctomycetota bacterium]